jgi:hypothetical protein
MRFLPRDVEHSREDLERELQRVIDHWLGSDASIDTS